MQSWRDTQKTHTQIQYDEKGRVLATKTASGHYADRFDYDEVNRCNTYFDAEGGVSRYWYNQDNLVTKIEDALGRITETKWLFSQKVEETDALGRKVSYVYNDNGCLTEIHSPAGESYYHYNKFGQIIEAVNPQGEKWQYQYCDKGSLIAAISPAGLTWDYHRDEKGRVNRISYPDGNYTIYGYDETKGQLQSVYNTRGERTSFEMDIFARPRWLTQADGSTYHYEYSQAHANPKGSLTKVTTPEGSTQQFGYNSERLLTEAIDGNGNRTRYGYGAFDLLEWQETPKGEKLHFGYDKLTRLTQVENAQGDVYRYEYDKAGQLIAETDFAGNHKTYAYDAAGRLVRQSQAGIVETFCYDVEDKLLCRQSWQMSDEQAVKNAEDFAKQAENPSACSQLLHEVRYEYNKFGQLIKTANTQYQPFGTSHVTEFEYDKQHRLIAEIQDGKRLEIRLDEYGRQVGLQLPNGKLNEPNTPQSAVKISQVFNRYGELEAFQVNTHSPLNFRYDKLGRQTEKRSQAGFLLAERFTPSGLLQAQGGGYDNDLTQQQLNHYEPWVQFPISGTQISRKWEYDAAFNLTATNDRAWGRTEYQSNRNGQITAVLNSRTGSELYGYDSQQNLTQKAVTETDSLGQLNHLAANDNRYRIKQHHGRTVRFGNTTYKYDSFGRLKAKTETKHGFRPVTTYYRWNSQNQLVELQSPFKGTWRYEYDSFGRRICKYQIPQENQPLATEIPVKLNQRFWRKQLGKPIPTVNFPAKGTQFVYHHNQLVAEIPLQTDGNAALAENWEEAIYWLYQDDDFTPTARLHKGELHYTVSDQIGTITELMSESGYIHYRQKLNLWGEIQSETLHHQRASNDEILCNLRFVGQYADEESGLYYNRFRYYSPETGQYVSSDPIGLLGGVNPYGYVGIPTGFVDPLGLASYSSNNPTAKNQQSQNNSTQKQDKLDTYDKARNKALEWLEEREFKAERVNLGKFGDIKGKPVGMLSSDGKTGFRVEYDDRSGAHINVFSGKEHGPHYQFDATPKTVTKIQRHFDFSSKPKGRPK